jgi:hypothetical protein
MPLRPGLLAEIGAVLGPAVAPNLTSATAASDLFEAYVWSMAVRAAIDEGAVVEFKDVFGAVASSSFHFRTSPGFIFSTAQSYTHAELSFPEKPQLEPLEAHVGVRVSGKSGVLHECDVAVLLKSEADLCRSENVSPRSARVVISAECKFYASDIPLGMARGFVGLTADLSAKDKFFVVNTESDSVERLLTHHARGWENLIVPGSGTVSRLRHDFRAAYKKYKAR